VRLSVDDDGARIEGTEQELADLASALLEAAVLGTVTEPVLLTDEGVASVRIYRTEDDEID
jgi:Fic family protein